MKTTENSSEKPLIRIANHRVLRPVLAVSVAALAGLTSVLSLQATVLDNFNGATLTGWTTTPTLNGGSIVQSGGQLQVATAARAGAITYGTKTSQSFANAANQTLGFRVDINAVVPGSDNPNPVAILAWLPTGAVPGSGSSGYSLSVSPGSATLQKGSTVLATASYSPHTTNLQNTTLVLRMTPSGGTMSVNARVYHQTGSLPMQDFTEVWETTQTVSESAGTPGYAALGVQSGASASGATISFDNLQVFVLTDTVLDDFSGGAADLSANYSVTANGPVAISGGHIEIATITYNNTIYSAVRRATSNYEITDGSRLEISVDVVDFGPGAADPNAFGSLSYTPFNSDAGIGFLIGYHIGAGVYGLSMGKAYGEWWVNQEAYSPPGPVFPIPSGNVRLIINMTGEGTNVRVESRVEDLSAGVNDPARVLYQNVFVDTAASDPFDTGNSPSYPDGTIGSAAAYLNAPGSIALYAFYGGNNGYSDVTFDNLVVNQTAPPNLPPSFSNIVPADHANFVAVATGVSFKVIDALDTPVNNISLTLNGVGYANGSGATVAGTATSRTFTLTAPLAPDTFYSGLMQATNSFGLIATLPYHFDTFRTNTCYVVESEDFNFNGGSFIDNPVLYADGSGPLPDGYVSQVGVQDIDYHDSRTSGNGSSTYRPSDYPRTGHTADGPRSQYVANGVPETVVNDRQNGDWDNYTHTYPSGWYTAYLRLSQYAVPSSLITLERVTSDRTQPNQTTALLGSFIGTSTGYDVNHDVQLTDAFGQPLLVHFPGGVDTLRVNNRLVQATGSELWQNYLVFAPAATPGAQPPFVAFATPAPGTVVGVNAPSPNATIVNRDTTVVTGSVIMQVNGATVPSVASPTASGADVTWTLASSTPTPTNTLIFKDSANVWQTNTWTYTYGVILQTNSLPDGSLAVPGFDARMVQSSAANLGSSGGLPNSVASAIAVLANPPQYTVDQSATNIVQTVNWGLSGTEYAAATNFPGLCLPPANINSFAIETLAYLRLTAGVHRFYVDSDDAVGVYSGTNLTDTSIVLVANDGVTHDSFDFFVPATGLYPFHVIYEEGGGAAYLRLQSVDLSANTTNVVNASGGVQAFYPLVCKSATSLTGPYTVDAAANAGNALATAPVLCDTTGSALNQSLTGGTVTVPISGATKFYRLDGPRVSKITNTAKSGSNVVITYTGQ